MNDYEIQKIRDTAFCSGYNTAVSKYENKIAELERKLEQTEKDLADYQFNYPTIKELEKENADLKEEINKIAFARGNLEEENAELKKRNAELKGMYAHSAREAGTYNQFLELKEKENAELKDELKKWKDEWQEQVQKATDEGYARTLQTIQLTKAVEIIKTLADDLSMYSGNYQKELLEAKQFLEENSISEHIQRATHNYVG